MARVVPVGIVVLALGVGCREGKTPDRELAGLVVAGDDQVAKIDVAKAVKDPAELGRAAGMPYHEVARLLGPHTAAITVATTVAEGTTQVDALGVETTIELGADGAWHAVANNTADYGREVIWSGGALYLRPRYARWHKRAPNDAAEPDRLRDELGSELGAAWDLLAPGAELTDRGARAVGARGGRVVEIKLSPSPKKPPTEALAQRKWRESRVVEAVAGELVLDADTGVVLAAKLTGQLAFVRDGKRYTMKIDAKQELRGIGQAVAFTVPPPAEVVATPERKREVDDRDAILDGIAPPIRKTRDDEAMAPAPGAGSAAAGSGSAAGGKP